MQPEMILKSDVLDILFENRNKDYGAYILRRYYDQRIIKSLLITFSLTTLILLLSFIDFKLEPKPGPVQSFNGLIVSLPPKPFEKPKDQPQKKQSIRKIIQPVATIKLPTRPVVVPDNKADKNIPTIIDADKKNISDKTSIGIDNKGLQNIDVSTAVIGNGDGKDVTKNINVSTPIDNPDVLPKFPGGDAAFKRFLERNLQGQDNMDDGQEVSVRVRFIVRYDGSISAFDVVESGGDQFDEEVLRVLKKMPRWIPGKTKGQDVSVYFVVPVKFVNP